MNALVLFALTVTASAVVTTHDVSEDCWDTGCQLNTWKVRGCEQYGRYSKAQRSCPGGDIYTCCKRGSVEKVEYQTVKSFFDDSFVNCSGVTKCLPKKSKMAGCVPVSKKVVKKMSPKPCIKGFVFSCCTNTEFDDDQTVEY